MGMGGRAFATDGDVVQRARRGDASAFAELVARHEAALYAYARSRVASDADAEQLAQDAFVEAYLSLARFPEGMDVAVWLRAICRNLVRHHYRSLGRRKETAVLEACLDLEEDRPAPDVPRDKILRCLERLDDLTRRVVEGFYSRSLSLAQIGAELGERAGTVGVMLHRARYRLRECLRRSGMEEWS
jgi:RNA polymerase sigma-70 factor (ECF subfamily)